MFPIVNKNPHLQPCGFFNLNKLLTQKRQFSTYLLTHLSFILGGLGVVWGWFNVRSEMDQGSIDGNFKKKAKKKQTHNVFAFVQLGWG